MSAPWLLIAVIEPHSDNGRGRIGQVQAGMLIPIARSRSASASGATAGAQC